MLEQSYVEPPERTAETVPRLDHELELHQIELEMQNEGLRQTLEELESARDRYAELYDFAPVGYFIFDARGVIGEVNLSGAQLLGKSRRAVVGKPVTTFIADKTGRGVFAGHLAAVVRDEGMQRCEIGLAQPGGGVIHAQLQSTKADASGSREGRILCSIVDVTAVRQLAEERNRLANIVESSHDAIFSVSVDHSITSWNRGAENIFGYPAEEIIGSPIFTIIPVDRHDERQQILKAVLDGEHVEHYETTRVRKDGSEIYVSITTSPVLSGAGKVIGNSVIARDVTEHRRMEETIQHQAHHDPLTTLPNRQLFMELLSLELADARRHNKKLALLFLDLNGFKQVNDTLGHDRGDRLLQEVALRLRGCIRESDTVARLGGDEFTVLMPDLGNTAAVGRVLEKILAVFETPFLLEGTAVDSSTSIGVCTFPDDGKDVEDLMKKADIAMYEAKGTGGNSYQFFNAELNARTINRQGLEEGLRLAVERDQLELLFYPVASCGTRDIIGAEALLRWRHPDRGLLSPEGFLDIAEDCGAIVPIGEWALRAACLQARAWERKGHPLNVCVNLSRRQFLQPNLVEKTAGILAETGLPPGRLEFDVTEQTIMADFDFALSSMQALTDMGITIIVDHFGCGSSSLQTIKTMPCQKVKLDRSLLVSMLSEPDDLAVVNAIVDLSHNLRMTVIASGVETEEQFSLLQKSGCDHLQGYLISAPLPPAEFYRLVAKGKGSRRRRTA